MIPGDLSDVPTLASLSKPQKRALILRDQLRYLEPAHLDSHLDGLTADEPPIYRRIKEQISPPLTQVTLKKEAARFDLGNVHFPEEGGEIHRVYLTVEDDRFEMRTEDALPENDAVLASKPIHRFVAENMFPLFKTKYKAIHARMDRINEARRNAYNMLDHPPAKFEDGETLNKLILPPKAQGGSSRGGGSRKRTEITRHIANKRQRMGLETIPDNVKSETFNTIPPKVKVDLFNNIVKTAFPNFDDLIVASWNVVYVYGNVGSDFPAFHRVVVELKKTLEEFERSFNRSRTRTGESREEAASDQQAGRDGSHTSPSVKGDQGTPAPAATLSSINATQPHENNAGEDQDSPEKKSSYQNHKPRPQPLQPNVALSDNDTKHSEHDFGHPTPPSSRGAHSFTRHTAGYTPTGRPSPFITSPSPSRSSPPLSNNQPPRLSIDRASQASRAARSTASHVATTKPSLHQTPGAELMRKRQEYAASLSKGIHSGAATKVSSSVKENREEEQHADGASEPRGQGEGGGYRPGQTGVAGRSIGGAKPRGSAPVAPMLPVRKERGEGL